MRLRFLKRVLCLSALIICSGQSVLPAQEILPEKTLNKPERLEWFRDQGFGLFIHWGVDSPLGVTISHSLVGASDDYVQRYFRELPGYFAPEDFHPESWARLAHLAGVRYVVLTTKHHSGFCMFDTKSTSFNVMQTPLHRDVTAAVYDAFRKQDIAIGVYFSPDDFHWLSEHKIPLKRNVPEVQPSANPELLKYDQQQVQELLTHYGPVQVIFFDGEAEGLRDLAWKLQPDIVVTRGALQTPEQNILGTTFDQPWEACITMGTAWQYQPQHEVYKSGSNLLKLLIQTRARGGNLLLNVGPKPNGELPIEEEDRLREIALWMFVNSESIYATRPWVISNEGDVWFTRKKNEDTLYAIVDQSWDRGTWKEIVLHSVRATDKTQVSILGQNDQVLEYQPKVHPKTTWHQEADGLHIRAMRTQRFQDNYQWANPAVLKITNVERAFVPPQVRTISGVLEGSGSHALLRGSLENMGNSTVLQLGFEYRVIGGDDTNVRTHSWIALPLKDATKAGDYSFELPALDAGKEYEVRAVVKHPLTTVYGNPVKLEGK